MSSSSPEQVGILKVEDISPRFKQDADQQTERSNKEIKNEITVPLKLDESPRAHNIITQKLDTRSGLQTQVKKHDDNGVIMIEHDHNLETDSSPKKSQPQTIGENLESQRFYCKYPNCNKSFTRLEHLSRHKLNHWPKRIFECSYVFPETNMKCMKTFVRKDLLVRHERRHTNGNNRLVSRKKKKSNTSQLMQNNPPSDASISTNSSLDMNSIPMSNANDNSLLAGSNLQNTALKYPNTDPNYPPPLNQVNVTNIGDPRSYNQFFDWVFDNNVDKNGNLNNTRNSPMVKPAGNQGDLKNLNPSLSLNANVATPTLGTNTSILPQMYDTITASSQPVAMITPQLTQPQVNVIQQTPNISGNENTLSVNGYNPIINILQTSNAGVSVPNGNYNLPSQQIYQPQAPISQPPPQLSTQLQIPQADSAPPRVQDLYSLDYLAADPLQNFMQELSSVNPKEVNPVESAGNTTVSDSNHTNNIVSPDLSTIPIPSAIPISTSNSSSLLTTPGSLTTDSRLTNVGGVKIDSLVSESRSTTSLNSPHIQNNHKKVKKPNTIIPKSQTSFIDSKRDSIKDNFLVQKSNINELKKQTYQIEGSSTSPSRDQHQQKIHNKKRLLESMKNIPSIFFPDPKTKYQLSKEKCQELYNLIPELRYIPYETLQTSLKSFWKNFHPQYGLLHKPSFNVNQQPPILILALIMTGANYLGVTYRETISDPICGPLRWIIFSHPDFQPPSRTYIIHSLLLLEKYEKASTNRYLHERSYLHHGTTIQLLRRTPSLGGHPLRDKTKQEEVDEEDEEEPNELNKVLTKWIEFESLKRVAFFAFYMDVTHAVVFGYMNLFISFRQIQLDLPCPDKIWESYDLSFEVLKESGFGIQDDNSTTNLTFLSSLKNLIRDVIKVMKKNSSNNMGSLNSATLSCMNEKSDSSSDSLSSMEVDKINHNATSDYSGLNLEDLAKPGSNTNKSPTTSIRSLLGKKLMLAGLLSVMFQCQEENDDPLISSILVKGANEQNITWREIISFAINYWMFEVQKDCNKLQYCSISDEINRSESNENIQGYINDEDSLVDKDLEVTHWNINDFDCKQPVYHMSQITLRIFHHDYYIAAGAPWRMNVMIGDKEFQSVQQRIIQFSKDTYTGGVAIIYAFQLLFEMFIRKDPKTNAITVDTSYDINTDTICTRPNSIALATLLIWTYSYTLYGPEILLWDNEENLNGEEMDEDTEPHITKKNNQDIQENYVPIENFDSYLIRMYNRLYISKAEDVISYQREVWQKAVFLRKITGQNNMIGFVNFIRQILDKSYWDLGRELGKLLNNCIQRSLGKKSHVCHDMYDV